MDELFDILTVRYLMPEEQIHDLLSKSPSLFFIQALEDSAVFEISYEKWLRLRAYSRRR